MKINDISESVAGPEKCWPGHRKVGTQPGTGKNAGKRVNDCEKIKEDDMAEGDKKPHPKTWHDVDPKLGKQVDRMSQAEKVRKGLAHPDTLKKKGVTEGAKWRKHPDAYNVDDEGNKTPRNPNSSKFGYDPLQRRADTANDAKTPRGKTAALKTSLKMAKGNKGVAEGIGNIGDDIRALCQKIYNAGDDEFEYFYNDSPIFAQYWDEYEGDLDSIIAGANPKELQIMHDELESYVQQANLAEGEMSPMAKDSMKADHIRSLKNLIAIAREQGRQLRVQELELELKKLQGVAEDSVADFLARGGQIQQGKLHKPRKGETWQGSAHIGAAGGKGTKGTVSGRAANTNPKGGKPVVSAEGCNPEYDDEAGMADNNLKTLARAVAGIDDLIDSGDNLPEWCQEKIAVAKSMLVAVWDYMESEEDSEEVDPEIDEMFEVMDLLAEELAAKHKVDVDTVWESFEALDDHMLYETAAWRRKEGKSKKGGLNAKGVASYRRENPGSKLQMAVTTKPSKLKPGSKAAKRRKSFCARMSGVKGPMKKPNGKPTRKALALRKWNC